MSHYKPYLAYKNSGVEWVGSFPEHWTSKKIMYWISGHGSGTTPSEETDYCEFGFPWVTTGELRENIVAATAKQVTQNAIDKNSALKIHPKGSLVIAMYGATVGRLGVLGIPATLNQACFAIHPCKELKMPFMRWWFEGFRTELIGLATGAGQPNISGDKIKDLFLAAPTSEMEQDQIIDHLDCETARIDGLVATKSRFIDLLREKRQAMITHAVTKGLDADVKMKDSGVEWLGSMPAHWLTTRIKYVITSIGQGWSPECEGRPVDDGEWGVLKVGCVNGGIFRPTENKALPSTLTPRPELKLTKGDVLVSRANTRELVGSCAVIDDDFPKLMLCDKLYRLIVSKSMVTPGFLATLISIHGRREVEIEANGASSSMVNIAQSVIKNLQTSLPPINEQIIIYEYLKRKAAGIDKLIDKTERSIELLKERRSALITAAVTGKIDVRGHATREDQQAG